jgi:hypothetical protein
MGEDLPVLGYGSSNPSSGFSGTETSEARVRTDDSTGVTADRQEWVLEALRRRPHFGLTVHDIRRDTGWHHGQASAALSNLHKAGKIVRLAQVRDGCKVYLMPEYALGSWSRSCTRPSTDPSTPPTGART